MISTLNINMNLILLLVGILGAIVGGVPCYHIGKVMGKREYQREVQEINKEPKTV